MKLIPCQKETQKKIGATRKLDPIDAGGGGSKFSSLAALAVGVAGEFATDLVPAGLLFISTSSKLHL